MMKEEKQINIDNDKVKIKSEKIKKEQGSRHQEVEIRNKFKIINTKLKYLIDS
jgi:hypothetical protein